MLQLMGDSTRASVVFLKIHEFARRPASEQARLRAQLDAVVAVTGAQIAPAGRLVLDAGDGAAIVVLGDPPAALLLAQRALAATAAGLPLAAGINHGAVQLDGAEGSAGMVGDGIAVAATAAGFAAPACVLASRVFRDALADAAPGAEASLVREGNFTDEGLRVHELFRPDLRAASRRRIRYAAAAAAAVLVLLGAGIGVRVALQGREAVMDSVAAQYRGAAARADGFWQAVLRKARFK
ncbi:MAG TPA: hypothetical protein VFX09_00525 [Burkholderiales bacterium]|nr:hypothetical protein [Burkholderiales bacterium]